MPLLTLNDISIAYGDRQLLDHANLSVESGQKLGLIGRNGEGKSTLLKIVQNQVAADDGEIRLEPGTVVATVAQNVHLQSDRAVFDEVAAGLGDTGKWLAEYHAISSASGYADADISRLDQLQQKLDAVDGWNLDSRVNRILSKLGLDGGAKISSLSGGWQRRVSLARALVSEPQLLLLDEPTNHLDIESIGWLEKQVINYRGTVIFVTHDREFLDHVATHIIELDRGKLTLWPGNFGRFQEKKAAALEAESRQNAVFDKKLAEEEIWIRKGIQARRTRNEGRVRALQQLRLERAQRREQQGKARLEISDTTKSGKLVIEASRCCFGYPGQELVKDFSLRVIRGDRIGLIGPNGVGKTTLLKLLLKQIEPQQGNVHHGTKLEIAYFDQLRQHLDEKKSVVDTIGMGREQIEINGKTKHVISYLSDFLFTPARARSPISALSGGERARVLLAILFSKPANLIVMDEPTNDLDIETLEMLEELLCSFTGTLFLVSHDRKFLDNVVTSTLAFEGNGRIRDHVGGYSDWLQFREKNSANQSGEQIKVKESAPARPSSQPRKVKLSYNQQRELDSLPEKIETLEKEQARLTNEISNPDFYSAEAEVVTKTLERLKKVGSELETCYQRWSELEG